MFFNKLRDKVKNFFLANGEFFFSHGRVLTRVTINIYSNRALINYKKGRSLRYFPDYQPPPPPPPPPPPEEPPPPEPDEDPGGLDADAMAEENELLKLSPR